MSPLRLLAAALIVAASACSHQSPEEQLLKSCDAAASWIPALQMVAEKWLVNSVPSTFVTDSCEAALKEFGKAQQSVRDSRARQDVRDRLSHDLRQGGDFAEALKRAAEQNDPRGIAPAMRTLPPVKSDLDALQKQYGAGS